MAPSGPDRRPLSDDSKPEPADQLTRGGHDVHGPAAFRLFGKRRLARIGPVALAPPALHGRERDRLDHPAAMPPDVIHRLAEPGRRVDRTVPHAPALLP